MSLRCHSRVVELMALYQEVTMTGELTMRCSRSFLGLSILLVWPLVVPCQQVMDHTRWMFYMGPAQVQSPSIGPDGTIYIGSGRYNECDSSDGLYAVNPDGTQKWKLTLGKTVHSSVAIDQDTSLYFIVGDANKPDSMDAALYSLSSSGKLRWKLDSIGWMAPIPNTGFTPALAADGTVYVCGRYSLFAVNPNGSIKWKYDFPLIDNIFSSGERHTVGSHRSAPTVAKDGTIYVNTMRGGHVRNQPVEGGVYAFDPNGNLKWRTYDIGGTAAPILDEDGTIYSAIGGYGVATDTGNAARLLAIHPDGTRKWAVETQLWCEASPSIGADGTLYIGTTHHPLDVCGWFYAITPDGQIKWKYDTYPDMLDDTLMLVNPPDIYNSPAIDANGRIYFGNEAGRFYAMNPDGTVAWMEKLSSQKYGSAAIADDGTLYIPSDTKEFFDHYALIALNTGSEGLADSPWPKFRQNNRNTGRPPAQGSADVVGSVSSPSEFALSANWPNPFNPSTTIRFTIAGVVALSGSEGPATKVRLAVYDLLGREVKVLMNERKEPGRYEVRFDATGLPSGVYIYRLTAGSFAHSKKMLLLR
jgi:outer membrane protein assembly factor BamB